MEISIHAPRVGSDRSSRYQCLLPGAFQSTLPVWGATGLTPVLIYWVPISIHAPRVGSDTRSPSLRFCAIHFNPRSPCGERPISRALSVFGVDFNPRSPCGERPAWYGNTGNSSWAFQSTLPVWGATGRDAQTAQAESISIHAPRVGSDGVRISIARGGKYFNPRSPCGERPSAFMPIAWRNALFQSTLPVWGAT